jgi:tetratricopeptide (TPR) repeat protein
MKRNYCGIIMLITLWMIPLHLHAAEDAVNFEQARAWFNQALDKKDGALEQATEQFEQLLTANPGHPVYQSYLGACKTLQGRDAWMPWNKMRYSEQGLDQIDKALDSLNNRHDSEKLQGVPLSLQTMLVAAVTFLNMPDNIFHRHARGKRLLKTIIDHPAYALTPEPFKKTVQQSWMDIR